MTEQSNKELVRRHFDAVGDDKEEFVETLAEEIVYNREVRTAQEHADGAWESTFSAFPDWEESILEILAEDDLVAVYWEYSGTHTGGEFIGVPPTDKEVEGHGNTIVRVEDDQITEIWTEWETSPLFEILGFPLEDAYEVKMRRQLLEVLLRVLRHNLRNDLSSIRGLADMIANEEVPGPVYAERIRGTAESLQATAEKANDLEASLVNMGQRDELYLPELVGTVVADQRQTFPSAQISISIPAGDIEITSNRAILSFVLQEAIENAAVHSDNQTPDIEVEVAADTRTEYAASIAVIDDGPGIPDHELAPLEQERERPLEHGSGLGLWAIKWGVEGLGGEVEFTEKEPRGSVVRFHLPDMI